MKKKTKPNPYERKRFSELVLFEMSLLLSLKKTRQAIRENFGWPKDIQEQRAGELHGEWCVNRKALKAVRAAIESKLKGAE